MTVDHCHCGEPFVSRGHTSTTLVGFSSPPGHIHDRNCMGRNYYCKSGHITVISVRRSCDACDWKGPETCFCHDGPKVERWPLADVPVVRDW